MNEDGVGITGMKFLSGKEMKEMEVRGKPVRVDLQEKAFRKYEMLIGSALHGSYLLNVTEWSGGKMKPRTFVVRLLDAILGFRTFKYKSQVVKRQIERGEIQVFVVDEHMVQVVCRKADEAGEKVRSKEFEEQIEKEIEEESKDLVYRDLFVKGTGEALEKWLEEFRKDSIARKYQKEALTMFYSTPEAERKLRKVLEETLGILPLVYGYPPNWVQADDFADPIYG